MKGFAARRDEAGFTLVELLIVIVIEALIVGALGSAFILVTNNSSQVKESLARSGDARIAAAYIVSDARNSSGPETSLADTASCFDPSPPVSGTPTAVVRFNWNSTSSAGATTPNIVNYVLVSNALLRRQCRNGSLVSDRAVANNVTSVSVACAPTANCSGTPTKITVSITETPETTGSPSFQYSLTGAFRKALAVGASLPLSISGPATMPAWTVNRPYSATIVAAGGDGNYVWSATGLPAGLTINPSTGVISGTPTAAGSSTTTVTLNDVAGDTAATRQYTVTINAAPSITTASPLPAGTQTLAYSTTLAGSGGTTAYSWSATGLPAGLSINTGGVISGTPTAAGTFTVAATLTDSAGATATSNLSLTINAAPVISTVALTNTGGVGGAGKIEKADVITVTFSAQMSVSSFCSTWSGDTTDQSLSANSDVTVNVSDGAGATNDALTVTSATCTFRFGSIDLGSNAYVSAATSFGGSSTANKSTITYTASTRTLTITLGAKISGTVAAVASSTPIYTASGSILGSSGAAIFNSPFTLAAAKQF
ncbi:MAG: hypothetical protein QOI44_1800 [Actinomycetota bacterium]|nr:hypothetical protein [Actinomycetota bacterium]